jgi:dipeptidyl aminopeptidase/acylaminoacyl peptidase
MTTNIPVKRYDLKDFFRTPEKSGYQISPDGNWISYLAPYERRKNIFVQPRAGGEAKRITSETARDMAGYFWKHNDRIIYVKDSSGDENFRLISVSVDGTDIKDLTPFDEVTVNIIDDLEEHPSEMIISMNHRNKEIFDVYRINVITGDMTMIAENPGNITSWVTDHDGKLRIARATDGVNSSLLYRESEDGEFRSIITTNFREAVSPIFFMFDNTNLYCSSNIGRDKEAIVLIDPATGHEKKVIFEHPEVDVEGLHYSRKRKVITYASYTTWKGERHFFDHETEKLFARLYELLPNYELTIVSHNKDEDVLIVRSYSDRSLGAYFLYEKKTDTLTSLAEVSPWLDENDLCERKPITYTSRDGLIIHGYLTLPKGKEANDLPVVVNPHGGPWHRDVWTYNPEAQFLANRGYAVFQMNFRGSVGYGRKFWEASFKQWGKTMQDDVSDGVRWLIEQGIANPAKVAIYGGSYGGYCTLAGMTFTPDLYACGIDYVGVSNLFTFMTTIPPYWKPLLEMMYEMVGDPEKDKELLRSASPVFHVDQIKSPLFVIQGAKDPRVNINESNQIVDALKKRGIDVPYMVKENEGHGFHNEENRFEVYEAMEKFLDKHLN